MGPSKYRRLMFWLILLAALLYGLSQFAAESTGQPAGEVVINELLAANDAGLQDQDGDFSDWIEIYNRSSRPVNLSGWSLTDDPQQPQKWSFPNVSLGSGQYLLVFTSGKDRQAGELHANFRLNQTGEFLGLYNLLENRLVDSIRPHYPQQFTDISYGRIEGEIAGFQYLANPTPGQTNDAALAWVGQVAPVDFSVPHGLYDQPVSLALSTDTPGAVIRFTTDGSVPTADRGTVYSAPLPIERTTLLRAAAFKPDYLPAPVTTQSYIFLADVLAQPADPPGFPNTWGMHSIDFAGFTKDTPVQADYEMDPEIVNDPRYGPRLATALRAIPSLSLVTDAESFKIYGHPRMRGPEWERPVSVEWIDPTGRGPGFQINAGIRIQGGAGRWEFIPKHSFRLFFRDRYGAGQLNYPVFAGSPVEEFDTLVLRGGVDRSFAGHPDGGDSRLTTYTRDEWLRLSQRAMSGSGSHGTFVHLYLNGLYWGLYNVVERPDDSFLAAYFGGDSEEWYAVNHSGPISGSNGRFKALLTLAERGQLAEPEQYAAVQAHLDISQFLDYVILNWYAGNRDWPHNNWYAGVRNPQGQVQYFVWDGEMIWIDGARLRLGGTPAAGLTNTVKPLFQALIQNPEFKMALADRLYKQLFNGGALTDAKAQARWRRLNNLIEPAIVAESARWGDVRFPEPITPDDWEKAHQAVLAQMAGNASRLIELARAAGYYPNIDPPHFNQQGGLISPGFTLTMTQPPPDRPTVYYTIDGSDPRQPATGVVASQAVRYAGPLALTTTTHVKARTLNGDEWSALNEVTFTVKEQPSQLAITEIMYNPPGGNEYEFIELSNLGGGDLNLANSFFDEGIIYTFPPAISPLRPGQHLVVARNPAAFAERYPDVAVTGPYQGKLANQGERITLRDGSGQVILSISYDDEQGWPLSPDGRGDSLVPANPAGDPDDPKNWRASLELFGSPGRAEPHP